MAFLFPVAIVIFKGMHVKLVQQFKTKVLKMKSAFSSETPKLRQRHWCLIKPGCSESHSDTKSTLGRVCLPRSPLYPRGTEVVLVYSRKQM